MERFKSFATKRIIIGIALILVVLWAMSVLMGYFSPPDPTEITLKKGELGPLDPSKQTDAHQTFAQTESKTEFETEEMEALPLGEGLLQNHEAYSDFFKNMGEDVITIKDTLSSGKATAVMINQHPGFDKLLYLYSMKTENEKVVFNFPGKLLVSPDDTPLKDLLVPDKKAIQISADARAVSNQLIRQKMPALAVLDDQQNLVGVVTTEAGFSQLKSAKHGTAQRKQGFSEAPVTGKHGSVLNTQKGLVHGKDAQEPPVKDNRIPGGSVSRAPIVADTHDDTEYDIQTVSKHEAASTNDDVVHGVATLPDGHGLAGKDEPDKPRGVAFIEATIKPLNQELTQRFWGWRPNDILNVTDNVDNFQLGVLEVTRRTAMVMAERISRTGITAAFDENLEQAMNWFMIKSDRYWLPSAESKYKEGLAEFEVYKKRLEKGEANFYSRADNLIPLLIAYEYLLGSCEENLVKHTEKNGSPVSFFKSDDYIFYAKGVVSAMATILEAIGTDFKGIIESRRGTKDLHHAIESCHHATEINPWIIFNSDSSSMFANHRANMAAPLSHARFYLGVLIKTLST